MTLRPSLPWLLTTIAVALLAMFLAAGALQKFESAIAAAVFVFVIVTAAIRTNAPVWRHAPDVGEITQRDALIATIRLVMLSFLWCGLAFFAIYLGTAIRWQHGWQYGSAMMLVAGAYAYYLSRLKDPHDDWSKPQAITRMVRFMTYQAFAIGVGLVWLVSSGKLATLRGDWAANQIFLAGGFSVMCLTAIIVKTNSALAEHHTAN
jgi:hypothetical protein